MGLISAIPHEWKEMLRSPNNTNYQKVAAKIYHAVELTCKRVRSILIQKKIKQPLASSRLRRVGVDDGMITAIYKLQFKIQGHPTDRFGFCSKDL